MSNLLFPKLRGVGWNFHIAPQWSTGIQNARSGRSVRTKFRSQPLLKITISFGTSDDAFLSDKQPKPSADGSAVYSDFETLFGFLNRHGGEHESFLFQGLNAIDLAKFTRLGELIATADGVTTDFQLVRNVGGWLEAVYWPQGPVVIYVDGVATAATDLGKGKYRIAAPTAGQLVTADFTLAYRVRFDADEIDFNNWMAYFWEAPTVPLITVKP
jgi:uncharacterized protein (TIGR02217 family)